MQSHCFLREFQTFQQWHKFVQDSGLQPRATYFNKYIQQTPSLFSRVSTENATTGFKSNFKFKAEKQLGEYTSGRLIRDKFKVLVPENILQYFIEKEVVFVHDRVQIQGSLLYKVVPGESFKNVEKHVKQNEGLRPDLIRMYVLSSSLQKLMDFTQSDDVKNQFIAEFARFLKIQNTRISHFGQIGARVNGLNKSILLRLKLEDFCWTIKIDGQRAFLVCDEKGKQYVLKQDSQQTFDLDGKYTIFDCEEYEDKFYIFDILHDKGKDVMNLTYVQRLELLKRTTLPKNAVLKTFHPIQSLADLAGFTKDVVDGVHTDGIVISNMTKTYLQTESYKLKDKKYLTNDYLVKYISLPTKRQKQLTGFEPGDALYEVYVGSKQENFKFVNGGNPSQRPYQEMLFSLPYFKTMPTEFMLVKKTTLQYANKYTKADEVAAVIKTALKGGLNDMIVECAFDDDMCPYPIRVREDKTHTYKNEHSIFGNDFRVARANLESAMDPITPEYLSLPIAKHYFNVQNVSSEYDAFRLFGRKCRQKSFDTLLCYVHGLKYALDIGAGRNAVYYLYLKHAFESVIAYEPDTQANLTYYSRMCENLKYSQDKMPLTYIVNQYCHSPVRERLSFMKVNFFTCDYAFHYLCDSENTIRDLKQFILLFAREGGHFKILDYDGVAVYNLLKGQPDRTWDNGRYHWELCDKGELRGFGQKVKVLLPTIHTEMTEEYLFNIDAVCRVFEPEIHLVKKEKMMDAVQMELPDEDRVQCGLVFQYIFEVVV